MITHLLIPSFEHELQLIKNKTKQNLKWQFNLIKAVKPTQFSPALTSQELLNIKRLARSTGAE